MWCTIILLVSAVPDMLNICVSIFVKFVTFKRASLAEKRSLFSTVCFAELFWSKFLSLGSCTFNVSPCLKFFFAVHVMQKIPGYFSLFCRFQLSSSFFGRRQGISSFPSQFIRSKLVFHAVPCLPTLILDIFIFRKSAPKPRNRGKPRCRANGTTKPRMLQA